MAERKRQTKTTQRTRRSYKRKSEGGSPLLLLLFVLGLFFVSGYVTDHMTNSVGNDKLDNVAAVHQIFGDKEKKGLVPDEDPGTPESVKEKIKAKLNQVISVEKKTDKKDTVIAPAEKEELKNTEEIKSTGNTYTTPIVRKTPVLKEDNSGKVSGKLVVVIDDAGRDLDSQHVYESLGIPLTLAVMPNQVHTREAALSWHAKGLPVIVHQPMESVSGIGMEQKTILTSMTDWEIKKMLEDSLAQVPEAVGINNHQGSKATTDPRVMREVMSVLSQRGLFFFDSHTNSTTAAKDASSHYGVPYAINDLFVDNSSNVEDIKEMIQEGANRAKKNGTYIIIGHCRPNTAEAFRQMVPKLEGQGIRFIYLSSVLR